VSAGTTLWISIDSRDAPAYHAPIPSLGGFIEATGVGKWLRILTFSAAAVVALLAVTAVLLWRATQKVPEFYARAVQDDPADRAEASDRMIQRATTLAGDVKKEGRWEATFTADEINGWLAVDLVENHADQLPATMSDPRVAIGPGRLMIACRYEEGWIEAVLSLEVDVYLAEPNVLALRVYEARAGGLPLPWERVQDQITQAVRRSRLKIEWAQVDEDPVATISLPPPSPQEPIAATIDAITLGDGEIYMSGTTERH
jgi:hypothetical protein